jgi:hypothetical protein
MNFFQIDLWGFWIFPPTCFVNSEAERSQCGKPTRIVPKFPNPTKPAQLSFGINAQYFVTNI